MKKLLFVSTLLVTAVLFNACGDSAPDDLPVSSDGSTTKSFTLLATAGDNTGTGEVTFTLDNFAAISEYTKWVKKGDLQTTSSIELTGILSSQQVELRKVSLALKNDSKKNISLSLPNPIENGKLEDNILDQLNFMQEVINEVIRRGSSTVILKYSPSANLDNSNAKMTMNLKVRFSF